MGEVAFLLFSFLRQDVALESVLSLEFSCSGKGEPFFAPELVLIFGILVRIINS